jgi:Uma2 family endonuclease
MSAVLEKLPLPASANGVKPRLITVAEYDRMIEAGIYTTNDPIELLNGELIEKMPKGIKHAYLNDAIADFLKNRFGQTAIVRSQNPIVLDNFSEPEPDLVLCQPPREKYLENHPRPEDILLIVEISDSTLYLDRNHKALAYARAGIIQYLLVNVNNQTIEDYRQPGADGYGSKQTYHEGDAFNLEAFPEAEVRVDELLSA